MAMSLNPQDQLAQWLEGVDIDQPLSELLELAWLEAEAEIAFTAEELAYLEEQGREYVQELYERGLLSDLPPLDVPDRFLEQTQDNNPDFGR